MGYFLRSGVFACAADRHCVFLDLARDRYLSVDRERIQALLPQIMGSRVGLTDEPLSAEGEAFAASLVAKRLLTLDPLQANGSDGLSLVVRPPSMSLLGDRPARAKSGARLALPFIVAATRAHLSLTLQPLKSTVDRVTRRRLARVRGGVRFDFARATDLVQQFDALRPWFTRNYLCLFDCLALLELLALHHLYPLWVFGVHADPFEAHCWLQQDDVVVNDTIARVETFTPIMAA